MTLSEKHRPKKYSDFIGQEKAIAEMQTFLKEFPKTKAILLYGPAGTGKTSLAMAVAKENNLEVFELNASDLRNRIKLEEILKPASAQTSLFKKGKILLVDEVDGVTGRSELGGVQELIRIIEKTSHPIIITGNDVWQTKLADLRKNCKLVEMKSLSTESVANLLLKISKIEGIDENPSFLRQIAIKSQGDVRAALNDLQVYSIDKTYSLTSDEKRRKEDNIFNILKLLFQERKDFLELFDTTDMSLDEILLWIEENIPREYKDEALARAYIALSKADVHRGRIYRQQHWRFLIYQNIFQSAGIAYSKTSPKSSFVKYERPKRILKIWLSNQKLAKKKTIAQKYAKLVHCSVRRAINDFETLKVIMRNPKIQEQLRLEDDEIDFLKR